MIIFSMLSRRRILRQFRIHYSIFCVPDAHTARFTLANVCIYVIDIYALHYAHTRIVH